MNDVTHPKFSYLREELKKIEAGISQMLLENNDKAVRCLIDNYRQVRSLFEREQSKLQKENKQVDHLPYTGNPVIREKITNWCNKIKSTSGVTASFEDYDFCNYFLDHCLPEIWDFTQDILVINRPLNCEIVKVASERGQKHIALCIESSELHYFRESLEGYRGIILCPSHQDLQRSIGLLQTGAQRIITTSCIVENQEDLDSLQNAITAGRRTAKENARCATKFGRAWATNTLNNLSALVQAKHLSQLNVEGVEDAVIVASGPSLSKNVHLLKDIQDSVLIVSPLRSLPILEAAGVTADVVIQLDAEDSLVANKMADESTIHIKNLLLEAHVAPGFFSIKADNYIWSLSKFFFDVNQHFAAKSTPFNEPSVGIYALQLCRALGMKNLCFIGQDLAASDGMRYADGTTSILPDHSEAAMFHIQVPGFDGGTVLTRNSYEYMIQRCSEVAEEIKKTIPSLRLFNATEGGAFIQGFEHVKLKDYIVTRGLADKKLDKKLSFTLGQYVTAEGASSFRKSLKEHMDAIIKLTDQIISIDSKPEKTRGKRKKLEGLIAKFQYINSSSSLLQIAMQDKIAEVVGTSEDGQKVGSYTDFFNGVKESAKGLKVAVSEDNI